MVGGQQRAAPIDGQADGRAEKAEVAAGGPVAQGHLGRYVQRDRLPRRPAVGRAQDADVRLAVVALAVVHRAEVDRAIGRDGPGGVEPVAFVVVGAHRPAPRRAAVVGGDDVAVAGVEGQVDVDAVGRDGQHRPVGPAAAIEQVGDVDRRRPGVAPVGGFHEAHAGVVGVEPGDEERAVVGHFDHRVVLRAAGGDEGAIRLPRRAAVGRAAEDDDRQGAVGAGRRAIVAGGELVDEVARRVRGDGRLPVVELAPQPGAVEAGVAAGSGRLALDRQLPGQRTAAADLLRLAHGDARGDGLDEQGDAAEHDGRRQEPPQNNATTSKP